MGTVGPAYPALAPAQDSALLADSLAAASPLRLVEARPANACTALALSPPPRGPFAVVVQRGLCEFGLKILNAERAGASAVLITEAQRGATAARRTPTTGVWVAQGTEKRIPGRPLLTPSAFCTASARSCLGFAPKLSAFLVCPKDSPESGLGPVV